MLNKKDPKPSKRLTRSYTVGSIPSLTSPPSTFLPAHSAPAPWASMLVVKHATPGSLFMLFKLPAAFIQVSSRPLPHLLEVKIEISSLPSSTHLF